MVALDNKIEQAMVSSITASLLSSDLAAAYVTLNRFKGMDAKVFSPDPKEKNCSLPILIGDLRGQLARCSLLTPPSQGFTAASGSLLDGSRGLL